MISSCLRGVKNNQLVTVLQNNPWYCHRASILKWGKTKFRTTAETIKWLKFSRFFFEDQKFLNEGGWLWSGLECSYSVYLEESTNMYLWKSICSFVYMYWMISLILTMSFFGLLLQLLLNDLGRDVAPLHYTYCIFILWFAFVLCLGLFLMSFDVSIHKHLHAQPLLSYFTSMKHGITMSFCCEVDALD